MQSLQLPALGPAAVGSRAHTRVFSGVHEEFFFLVWMRRQVVCGMLQILCGEFQCLQGGKKALLSIMRLNKALLISKL